MKIGIDLDDVLVGFVPAFLLHYNRRYKTAFSRADVWSYHFWEVFGIPKDETLRRVFAFLDSPDADYLDPIAGAREGIAAIADGNELHVITARQDRFALMTSCCLAEHFDDVFEDVHFANHFSDDASHLSKGVICDRLGIDVFIDDSLANAIESASPERKVLLFDAPWNASAHLTPSITRVRSWEDIVSTIGTLSFQHSQV